MPDSESQEDHEDREAHGELAEVFDILSASYELQIQQHRELIRKRRQRRANSDYTQAAAAPDFTIRPRRAA